MNSQKSGVPPFAGDLALLDAACDNLVDGAVRLFDLHVRAAKAALMEAALASRHACGPRPAMELCLEGARYGQSQWARAFSYGNEVAGIVGGVHDGLAALLRAGARPPVLLAAPEVGNRTQA